MFDFGFKKFVTAKLIPIIWAIEVILSICMLFGYFFAFGIIQHGVDLERDSWVLYAIHFVPFAFTPLGFIVTVIATAFNLLLTRVILEFILVLFKIEENSRAIRERLESK